MLGRAWLLYQSEKFAAGSTGDCTGSTMVSFQERHEDVLSLSGIGAYTAGAICSICYEQPTPAVDGNVLRVVMRLQDAFMKLTEMM